MVYRSGGLDWRSVSRVEDPTAEQRASFEPGEMKLYLVAPRDPEGLELDGLIFYEARVDFSSAVEHIRRVIDGAIRNDRFFRLFDLKGTEMKTLSVFTFGGVGRGHRLWEIELYD